MKSYRTTKRIRAAEFRKSCLINIDMRREAFTAYGRSALILHAIYPQLPLRHVTGEDGMTRPMVTDIPQKIILEVCRRYRLVEATAKLVDGDYGRSPHYFRASNV
ncbi:hypothetical protein EII33_10510 [Bacteroides heparinolyticus]|uniref:Uncharacterized protein n=1 Tax=Prevotella heparinolytica TaxID=28113 RepID=A0A3P2A4N9_9BACE|nr:hypothetical protein [Bacteroides heparinolyticus]RRD89190.1 hypothetical protein EII33_10510 [Bacteroides heparinolyticus]